MRLKHTYVFATTLCALALMLACATPARAASPNTPANPQPPEQTTRMAGENAGEQNAQHLTLPYTAVICKDEVGKGAKSQSKPIPVPPGSDPASLCPGGVINFGIYSVHTEENLHVPVVPGGAAPQYFGGYP